jgi:hypothetical protein
MYGLTAGCLDEKPVEDVARLNVKHQGVIIQPNQTFQVIWIAWVVSWIAASFWSGRTAKRATTCETWIYRATILAGAVLVAPWTAHALGESQIWQIGDFGACALVGVMLVGLALTGGRECNLAAFGRAR